MNLVLLALLFLVPGGGLFLYAKRPDLVPGDRRLALLAAAFGLWLLLRHPDMKATFWEVIGGGMPGCHCDKERCEC